MYIVNEYRSFCLVAQLCPTPCDPMDCCMPGFPVLHYLLEFAQTHVHWVSDTTNHLVLCCPLLLPPSIFPSIRVFSNESALHIRWPEYWSLSFSISPSNEYSGLISFRKFTWSQSKYYDYILFLIYHFVTLEFLIVFHMFLCLFPLSWPHFSLNLVILHILSNMLFPWVTSFQEPPSSCPSLS